MCRFPAVARPPRTGPLPVRVPTGSSSTTGWRFARVPDQRHLGLSPMVSPQIKFPFPGIGQCEEEWQFREEPGRKTRRGRVKWIRKRRVESCRRGGPKREGNALATVQGRRTGQSCLRCRVKGSPGRRRSWRVCEFRGSPGYLVPARRSFPYDKSLQNMSPPGDRSGGVRGG